jgi:hypothetical protein
MKAKSVKDILPPKPKEEITPHLDTLEKKRAALYNLCRDYYAGSCEFLDELESLFPNKDKIWRRTFKTYGGYDWGEKGEFMAAPRDFIEDTDGDNEAVHQFIDVLNDKEVDLALSKLAGI